VPALRRGNTSPPSPGNGCPSTGWFLPLESSPITLEMLWAIAAVGLKALILVWLHPGYNPDKTKCWQKCRVSAQVHSWGARQTPSHTSEHSLQEGQEEQG